MHRRDYCIKLIVVVIHESQVDGRVGLVSSLTDKKLSSCLSFFSQSVAFMWGVGARLIVQ